MGANHWRTLTDSDFRHSYIREHELEEEGELPTEEDQAEMVLSIAGPKNSVEGRRMIPIGLRVQICQIQNGRFANECNPQHTIYHFHQCSQAQPLALDQLDSQIACHQTLRRATRFLCM
jgi:hypothetical protein